MKQRFSSLDVKVIAHELSVSLVTLRLANIYDLSSKIFLLKFAKPDEKSQLIIDSGFRCHLTSFSRTTAAAPSQFVSKLRKILKTRRVTSISQVGTDRIIEFQFSDGEYRMFLEFFAAGNIILTDKELKILALLRTVAQGEGQEEQRVGLDYSLTNRQNYSGIPPLSKERLQEALRRSVDTANDVQAAENQQKKKSADILKKILATSITEFPPILLDHAMRATEFDSTIKPAEVLKNEELLDKLLRSLHEAQRVVQEITSSKVPKGYIIAKRGSEDLSNKKINVKEDENHSSHLIYNDFHPFRPCQFEEDPSRIFLEFDGFNKTVDQFFSSIEGQKLESRLHEKEAVAKRKLDSARKIHEQRVGALQQVQELNYRKASAIEANVERVQEAMDAVNILIAQSMGWVEMGKYIELQQKRHNPVAEIIKLPLKLHENTITLLLAEENFDGDSDLDYVTDSNASDSEGEQHDDSKTAKIDSRLTIDINLGISPWSNAREYYDQKRSAAVKEQKTLQSSAKALKNTEQKISQELKRNLKQEKAVLRPLRQQMWFEKFIWFISSDGYLILGGRDAQQTEILYKKYLRKGDVYVHADSQGAVSVVIRNNPSTRDAPIPPSTLSQAGTLAVASSSAWNSKAGVSAWWVNANQVSKSTPTGDFLPVGSFMIHDKKNFLPPAQLLLGFGFMFHISEESKANHVKHRLRDDEISTVNPEGSISLEESLLETSLHDNSDDIMIEGEGYNDDAFVDRRLTGEDSPLSQLPVEEDPNRSASTPEPDSMSELKNNAKQVPGAENNEQYDVRVYEESAIHPETEHSAPGVEKPVATSEGEGIDLSDAAQLSGNGEVDLIPSTAKPKQKGPKPLPRGKRSKSKKAAAKYKDQDEEDRRLVQAITGATLGREKAETEAKAKAQREAEAIFQKERRKAQHQRTQKEMAEHEEARRMMLEKGVETLDDEEADKAVDFDVFVGNPLPGDEIFEAIPICAPWTSLVKYKYKAKLQPGTLSKGKAVTQILNKWIEIAGRSKAAVDEESRDTEKMWPREVELIRGWKPEECLNCVPVGKMRVMMGGGSAGAASKDLQKGRGAKGSKKHKG